MEPPSEEHPAPPRPTSQEPFGVEARKEAPEEHLAPPRPVNPINVGFALVVAFAIGLALGFLGRPQIISDIPIQVVVTVVSENSGESVAQAPASNSQPMSNTSPADSSTSVSETNSAATRPEQQSSGSTQAMPTIMDFVMADARHIDGNMDAAVTIIEFSDFK